MKELQSSFDTFIDYIDRQLSVHSADSLERFKKRWQILYRDQMKKDFGLSDIPVLCDRIPNPFGR